MRKGMTWKGIEYMKGKDRKGKRMEEQEGKDGIGKEREGNSVESKCFYLHDAQRKGITQNVNNDERRL